MNVKVVRTNSTCTVQVQVFQSNIYFVVKTINIKFLAPLSQPIGGSTKLIYSVFVARVCPLTDPLTEPCTGFLQISGNFTLTTCYRLLLILHFSGLILRQPIFENQSNTRCTANHVLFMKLYSRSS